MFSASIDNKKVLIDFDYLNDAGKRDKNNRIITICQIMNENREVISDGSAFLNVLEDSFNKETGRKVALTRALESFPKEIRKQYWNAYLNRKKK